MNNRSLAAECIGSYFGNVTADPDIAGTGVRVDFLREWLDHVH